MSEIIDIFEITVSLETTKNFCVTFGLEEEKPERGTGFKSKRTLQVMVHSVDFCSWLGVIERF